MDGEAGWWITSGKIGTPPSIARVMGVGSQQQPTPCLVQPVGAHGGEVMYHPYPTSLSNVLILDEVL